MNAKNELLTLLVSVKPITPRQTINDAAQLFLEPENRKLLCFPVVGNDGRLMGTLSRQRIQNIFIARFGRELYGRKSVTSVMNEKPLVVEIGMSIEAAAQYISAHIEVPVTEDFIITGYDMYLGVGFVLDLLKVMEIRIQERNSELADAYRNLKASQTQLIQSEKMASLGQMVAGVAHEINTPLGYVRNNVELTKSIISDVRGMLNIVTEFVDLVSSGSADESQLQQNMIALDQARKDFAEASPLDDLDQLFDDTIYGVDQISEIVVNLKNFSRLDQAAVANVNINQCVESALVITKNVLKHKCDVIKHLGELPTVSCSPSQINQVFLNLLTNAAQAIENWGTITVTTWSEAGYVHACVADTGKGITEENLSKIFDPFFTTKPIGQGTGLGLSIVYNIVQQHHGYIRAESHPGKGTRFTLSLPLPAVKAV